MNTRLQWIKEGMAYALPLVIAVILRIIVGLSLILIFNLSYAQNGDTGIAWGSGLPAIKEFLYLSFFKYCIDGLIYFPIGIFVIMIFLFVALIFYFAIKERRILPLLLGGQ